jgi:hypothetical protein
MRFHEVVLSSKTSKLSPFLPRFPCHATCFHHTSSEVVDLIWKRMDGRIPWDDDTIAELTRNEMFWSCFCASEIRANYQGPGKML